MRRFNIIFSGILLVIVSLSSCVNNNGTRNNTNIHEKDSIKDGIITMTMHPDKNNEISFRATTKTITIDWGDGCIEDLTPDGIEKKFLHKYTNQKPKIIKIDAEDITRLIFPKKREEIW